MGNAGAWPALVEVIPRSTVMARASGWVGFWKPGSYLSAISILGESMTLNQVSVLVLRSDCSRASRQWRKGECLLEAVSEFRSPHTIFSESAGREGTNVL